jgi:hypothetical protein
MKQHQGGEVDRNWNWRESKKLSKQKKKYTKRQTENLSSNLDLTNIRLLFKLKIHEAGKLTENPTFPKSYRMNQMEFWDRDDALAWMEARYDLTTKCKWKLPDAPYPWPWSDVRWPTPPSKRTKEIARELFKR